MIILFIPGWAKPGCKIKYLDALGKYNAMQYLLELPKVDWNFRQNKTRVKS